MCLRFGFAPYLAGIAVARQGPVDKSCGAQAPCHNVAMASRVLTLADVQENLNISSAQAYALVRSGELPAIQVGGRGQWRVEATELEHYIQRQYQVTREKFDVIE